MKASLPAIPGKPPDVNGWDESAEAWIADQGEEGDWSRRYVLDPVMKSLLGDLGGQRVLDVGSGEGRFSRWMQSRGAEVVGVEPTLALIREARNRGGDFVRAFGAPLPIQSNTFDRVVFYLVLIDIPDFAAAIYEGARVLKPGGKMLVANLNPFATSVPNLWQRDETGQKVVAHLDHYLEPQAHAVGWRGINIVNFHRPQRDYMQAFLAAGLELRFFDEPEPAADAPYRDDYRRAPYHQVTLWQRPNR
jgi:ubiquinone/menaquinone biosynthesis C-methylase UbiE